MIASLSQLEAAVVSPVAESRVPQDPAMRSTDDVVSIARVLADGSRVTILSHLIQDQELNVTQLCDILHQSQPAVSHHLKLMRDADVVRVRRDGKHNFYSVSETHIDLLQRIMCQA